MSIERKLQSFVNDNSKMPDIQWDRRMSPKLPLNPYGTEKEEIARYFLLVAAILEGRMVGPSGNARRALVYFYKAFGSDLSNLFTVYDAESFRRKIKQWDYYDKLNAPLKSKIPDVMASVNRFVHHDANDNLLGFSESARSPVEFVRRMGKIERMGGILEDKSWVFMRWMVRPNPDLRIFNFSKSDLLIPLTRPIAKVLIALGWLRQPPLWENAQDLSAARQNSTEYAKALFPEDHDPAKVDYPFLIVGRMLEGMKLNRYELAGILNYLEYLKQITGRPHSYYQNIGRYGSGWEMKVRQTLRRFGITFHEQIPFLLTDPIPKYKADFVLDISVENRQIVLEPHYPIDQDFVDKLTKFRQMYGQKYNVIILVRNNDITGYRAQNLINDDMCDDVYPIEDIHILADQISKGEYRSIGA